MKTIAKGNKQLRIDDARLAGYLALGYTEIDPETGAPVKTPVHDDAAELATLREENASLKKANAALAAKIKDSKPPKGGAAPSKPEEVSENTPAPEE